MVKLVATITDNANAMMRRLGGQRLCEYCQQWAKKPHLSGGLYFCDNIHGLIYYKKQQELMKQALEKKKSLEKPRQRPETASPASPERPKGPDH